MSLVGAMVTIGIITTSVYFLLNAQDIFFNTSKNVEMKESVLQDKTAKAAMLQSDDFLRLEQTCTLYQLSGSQPGNCLTNSTSAHAFLYHWYNADPSTKMCIELTSCTKKAGGKLYEVIMTAHYETKGNKLSSSFSFRKAK